MRSRVNIPSDIAIMLFRLKIVKPFLVFVYLKLNAPSAFNNPRELLKNAETVLGLKQRTLMTHFDRLVRMGWVGKDQNGVYYLRSMHTIRRKLGLSDKNAVLVTNEHLKNLEEYCISAFLALSIKKQQAIKWIYKNKRKKSRVVLKQLAANHRDEFFYEYNYFGMSSSTLAKKLGVSRSKAQRHLKKAHKLGYIKLKKKIKKLYSNITSNEINCIKRSGLYENHKLLVRRVSGDFSFTYHLYLQRHNEILPFLNLKRIKSWKKFDEVVSLPGRSVLAAVA